MSLNSSNRGNYVDSALFLSPPNNWGDVVEAMKPGAHLLLFNDVRNHHLGAIAVEDHGLEIRDTVAWVFANGENDAAMKLVAMARKPLEGTVAANVLKWGCGGLNIDGCRIEHVTVDGGNLALNPHLRSHINGGNGGHIISTETERRVVKPHMAGRWPANLIHCGSPSVQAMFPDSKTKRIEKPCPNPEITGHKWGTLQGNRGPRGYDGDGSAARFFYSAPCLNSFLAYLIKLITPPGGTVLTSPKDLGLIEKAVEIGSYTILGAGC